MKCDDHKCPLCTTANESWNKFSKKVFGCSEIDLDALTKLYNECDKDGGVFINKMMEVSEPEGDK